MLQVGVGLALLTIGAGLAGYTIPTVLQVRRRARIYRDSSTWMVWQQDYTQINGFCLLLGEIQSGPTLTSPLAGKACAAWEVILDNGVGTVWSKRGFGDLTVSWEQTRPPAGHLPTDGGRVAVRSELIEFAWDCTLTDPPGVNGWRSADPDHLARLDCPIDILDKVRAAPHGFRVAENLLTTGDHVTLLQVPESKPASLPDPDLPFTIGAPVNLPRLAGSTRVTGAIAVVAVAVGLLLLVTYRR